MKKVLLSLTLLLSAGIGQESAAQLLPDSMESFSRKASGEFDTVPQTTIYTYDMDGNLTEEIHKDVTGDLTWKNVYIYQMGRVTETHSFNWAGAQGWVPDRKEFVSYDQYGTDTMAFYYTYNSPTDPVLQHAWRTSMAYDDSGRVITSIFYVYSEPNWYPSERVNLFYDGTDTLPSEAIAQVFDADANQWINTTKTTHLKWELGFDPNYNKTQPSGCVAEYWENGGWVKGMYDSMVVANGKIIEEIRYWYNEDNAIYELGYSMHNTYDNHGVQVMRLDMEYDSGNGDTSGFTLDTFDYGSNDEILRHIHFHTDPTLSIPFGYKEIYYYGSTALSAPVSQDLKFFPNPVVSGQKVQIGLSGIQAVVLWNSQGQELRYWDHPPENGLSTEGLPPGLYFLRASGTTGYYIGRLVVR